MDAIGRGGLNAATVSRRQSARPSTQMRMAFAVFCPFRDPKIGPERLESFGGSFHSHRARRKLAYRIPAGPAYAPYERSGDGRRSPHVAFGRSVARRQHARRCRRLRLRPRQPSGRFRDLPLRRRPSRDRRAHRSMGQGYRRRNARPEGRAARSGAAIDLGLSAALRPERSRPARARSDAADGQMRDPTA